MQRFTIVVIGHDLDSSMRVMKKLHPHVPPKIPIYISGSGPAPGGSWGVKYQLRRGHYFDEDMQTWPKRVHPKVKIGWHRRRVSDSQLMNEALLRVCTRYVVFVSDKVRVAPGPFLRSVWHIMKAKRRYVLCSLVPKCGQRLCWWYGFAMDMRVVGELGWFDVRFSNAVLAEDWLLRIQEASGLYLRKRRFPVHFGRQLDRQSGLLLPMWELCNQRPLRRLESAWGTTEFLVKWAKVSKGEEGFKTAFRSTFSTDVRFIRQQEETDTYPVVHQKIRERWGLLWN